MINQWRVSNAGPTINKEGACWWRCLKHRNGRGLHVRHKSEDHGETLQLRKREKIEASVRAASNNESNASRKLTFLAA